MSRRCSVVQGLSMQRLMNFIRLAVQLSADAHSCDSHGDIEACRRAETLRPRTADALAAFEKDLDDMAVVCGVDELAAGRPVAQKKKGRKQS